MAIYNAFPACYFLGTVETFEFVANSDLSENSLCVVGRLIGITRQSFKTGETAVAMLTGKMSHYNVELASAAADTIAQGTEIYLNSSGKATTSAGGNTLFGCLYQAAAAGDTHVDVLLYHPMYADTNTTYSAFTGTTGAAAGAAGLVPAPATTDAGKVLKADGTWMALPTLPVAENQAASEANDVAGIVSAFNSLLSKLKAAGLMAADAESQG